MDDPQPQQQPVSLPLPQPVGIYGWRKRCLYSFVVMLMVVVIVNLALTIWILRVLDFSIDGMGKLRIVAKGIRLEGEAEFVRPIYTQEIRADPGSTLRLESAQNIKLQARGRNSQHSGALVLGNNQLQAACETFEVVGSDGDVRLSVTQDNVTVGVDDMTYLGKAVFQGSVQTPTLRGPNTQPLTLRSENSKVEVAGAGGVSLRAAFGDVQVVSDDNVRLQSTGGSVFLESNSIFLKELAVSAPQSGGQRYDDVYQLCMCDTGRLFLAEAEGDCVATPQICGNS